MTLRTLLPACACRRPLTSSTDPPRVVAVEVRPAQRSAMIHHNVALSLITLDTPLTPANNRAPRKIKIRRSELGLR